MNKEIELVGSAFVPDGVELRLVRSDDDFAIVMRGNELMSTDVHASEQALATLTCARIEGRSEPQILIGGYGMGFTLRAALASLGEDASVTVVEIVPEIIEWARGPMHRLTAGCLEDPRVHLIMDDVATFIECAREGYDAILLDVDNGPNAITCLSNDGLYSAHGLEASMKALKPGGILAIWSAEPDAPFVAAMEQAGFAVTEEHVNCLTDGTGGNHVIWFARKPD